MTSSVDGLHEDMYTRLALDWKNDDNKCTN